MLAYNSFYSNFHFIWTVQCIFIWALTTRNLVRLVLKTNNRDAALRNCTLYNERVESVRWQKHQFHTLDCYRVRNGVRIHLKIFSLTKWIVILKIFKISSSITFLCEKIHIDIWRKIINIIKIRSWTSCSFKTTCLGTKIFSETKSLHTVMFFWTAQCTWAHLLHSHATSSD